MTPWRRDVTKPYGPAIRSEFVKATRRYRCRGSVDPTRYGVCREPLMLMMTRGDRPRSSGGLRGANNYRHGSIDAIGQVGMANTAPVERYGVK